MSVEILFSQEKFIKELDKIDSSQEISEIEGKAFNIIGTIVDYIDCYGSFINSIDREALDIAHRLIKDDNLSKIQDLNRCTVAVSILDSIKNTRKAMKQDLF